LVLLSMDELTESHVAPIEGTCTVAKVKLLAVAARGMSEALVAVVLGL
jgi:hypothetical protein